MAFVIGAGVGVGLSHLHCRLMKIPHTTTLRNKYMGLSIFVLYILDAVLAAKLRTQ